MSLACRDERFLAREDELDRPVQRQGGSAENSAHVHVQFPAESTPGHRLHYPQHVRGDAQGVGYRLAMAVHVLRPGHHDQLPVIVHVSDTESFSR